MSASVVLLRIGSDDGRLATSLETLGIATSVADVGSVEDRPDDQLLAEVGELARFRWVAVTSRNAARRLGLWANPWPPAVLVGVVGHATEEALGRAGVRCDAVSPDGTAAGLAACIDAGPVLFLRARQAREELVERLAARGIAVEQVVAYDTTTRALDAGARSALRHADAVVALSPSALDAVLDTPNGDEVLRGVRVVAIGPTTAAHAASRGVRVDAVAQARSAEALADAILRATGADGTGSGPATPAGPDGREK